MQTPLSDCEVRDPRVRRTRLALKEAFRGLLQTRNFEEISVQDIAEAATVNRATFYDHYSDKFALLESLVAGGFHKLLDERHVSYDGSCPQAARAVIEAACDYLILVHDGRPDCKGQTAFEPLMDAAMTEAIRRVLLRGAGDSGGGSGLLPAAMAASIAGHAIYGAVKEWFRTANRPSTEVIVPEILGLILPLLPRRGALSSPLLIQARV